MNSSLWSADRGTHLKIVIVATVASLFVTAIGLYARGIGANAGMEQIARPSANSSMAVSVGGQSAIR